MSSKVVARSKFIYSAGKEIGVSNSITAVDLFVNPMNIDIARVPCRLTSYLVLFPNIANSVFVSQIPVN